MIDMNPTRILAAFAFIGSIVLTLVSVQEYGMVVLWWIPFFASTVVLGFRSKNRRLLVVMSVAYYVLLAIVAGVSCLFSPKLLDAPYISSLIISCLVLSLLTEEKLALL